MCKRTGAEQQERYTSWTQLYTGIVELTLTQTKAEYQRSADRASDPLVTRLQEFESGRASGQETKTLGSYPYEEHKRYLIAVI